MAEQESSGARTAYTTPEHAAGGLGAGGGSALGGVGLVGSRLGLGDGGGGVASGGRGLLSGGGGRNGSAVCVGRVGVQREGGQPGGRQ